MNERLILVETGYHKALSDSFQFLLHMQKKKKYWLEKFGKVGRLSSEETTIKTDQRKAI